MAEVKTYITELIKDLNSDKLDNQHGSYYLDWTNFTNIPSSLTNISETIDDEVYSLLVAGSNITLVYDDASNPGKLTINAAGGEATSIDAANVTNLSEAIDDRVYSLVIAGTNITITYNDEPGDSLTINANSLSSGITDFASAVDTEAYSYLVTGTRVAAYDHDHVAADITDFASAVDTEAYSYLVTGTRVAQYIHNHVVSDVTDFGEAVDDRVYSLLTTGSHLTFTYTDNDSSAGNLNLTTDATASDNANTIVSRDSNKSFDITAIDFSVQTDPPSVLPAAGRILWNNDDGTLDIGLKGGNVVLQVGQEQLARIYNDTGETLTEGTIVYVTGSQGQRLTVAKAQANSEATSSKTMGIVTEAILDDAEGFIATSGLVRGLNTYVNGSSEGTAIWLSPTVAGAWTTTKPTAPNHMVLVGWIVRENSSSGSIFAHIQNGYELNEIHDVLITNPQHSDVLLYDSAGYYWKNTSFATAVDNEAYSYLVTGTRVAAYDHDHVAADITDFASAVDTEAYSYLVTGTRVAQFTHTHTASAITDFSEAVDDEVYNLLVAGTNITLSYNDGTGKLTINSTAAGTVNKYAASIGNGSATSYTVTHNLGTQDVSTTVYETASPYSVVLADIENTDIYSVTIRFASAPTTNQYRVVVIG